MIQRVSYLDKLKLFFGAHLIKVISGIRRCGKSVLMKQYLEYLLASGISESNILYINKESLEYDFLQSYQDLYRYIREKISVQNGNKYLLIDEIQEIEGWEKAINSLFSEGSYDIVITGSNSRMQSKELSTLLAGRYIEITVYPLSFREFVSVRKAKTPVESQKELFNLYLRYGGMPGIHHLPLEDEAIFPFLNALLNTAFLKDVVARHKIRDVEMLERMARFVFSNCGNFTSAKSISGFLKSRRTSISVETVQNYLHFLAEACIIHRVRRFDIQGKRELEYYEKFYMADIGLRYGVTGYSESAISGILENLIHNELIYRGYTVKTGQLGNYEIDFIAEKPEERLYIQVAHLLEAEKTHDREFGSLLRIPDNHPKMVISLDEYGASNRDGVIRKNIIDFLSGA